MRYLLIIAALAAGAAGAESVFIEPEVIHMEPLGEIEFPAGKILADTVILTVTIAVDGTVKSVKVWSSSGSKAIDALAVEAAKKCIFRPAYRDGEAVEYCWQIYYRLSTYKRMEYTSGEKKTPTPAETPAGEEKGKTEPSPPPKGE